MRTLAAAVLAVPILLVVYVSILLRRSRAARMGLAMGAGALIGLAAIAVAGPPPSRATPPSDVAAVADARFGTGLRVNQSPGGPISIDFATPMDAASVAASLSVLPPAPVAFDWNADRTRLTVRPTTGWDPGTYYTVTVDRSASDEAGTTLRGPVRAAFYVRPATAGQISVGTVGQSAGKVKPDVPISLDFDRPVALASLEQAFRIDPPVDGSFEVGSDVEAGSDREHVRFVPATPLKPGTSYTISLVGGVVDADGAALGPVAPLSVTTVDAPGIVRFRPLAGTADVAPDAAVSVRFTQPMNRASTVRAFAVTVDGTPVKGKVRWAEKDTVLVFDPTASFPPGATVAITVSGKAHSRDGVGLDRSKADTFTVEKPKPKPKPAPAPKATSRKPTPAKPPASTSIKPGGPVVSGSWRPVEAYLLKLLNCTRQGGWVTSKGACSSPGGRNVPPLVLDAGISSRVARPYAKYLAASGRCNHFYDGNPGTRLRRAGFSSYRWAENIGCSSASAHSAALATQLFFQSEKPYNGGHYRNLMNAAYTRAGVGVWVVGGRVRLVIDFYRP